MCVYSILDTHTLALISVYILALSILMSVITSTRVYIFLFSRQFDVKI